MPYCPGCGREVLANAQFCANCGRNLASPPQQQQFSQSDIPPAPSPSFGSNYLDSDASAAKTLTLVAIILQVIFFMIGLVIVLSFLVFFRTLSSSTFTFNNGANPTAVTSIGTGTILPVVGIFSAIFGFSFLISIIWMVLDYVLIYRNLQSPQTVSNARTPAIVLGIIQLLFGGVIPGILLIVAYIKIGDSMRNRGQMY